MTKGRNGRADFFGFFLSLTEEFLNQWQKKNGQKY
jgi:hypothetical protein